MHMWRGVCQPAKSARFEVSAKLPLGHGDVGGQAGVIPPHGCFSPSARRHSAMLCICVFSAMGDSSRHRCSVGPGSEMCPVPPAPRLAPQLRDGPRLSQRILGGLVLDADGIRGEGAADP